MPWPPNRYTLRTHQPLSWPSFAFPHDCRFCRFSCEVRPVGRGRTFVPGKPAPVSGTLPTGLRLFRLPKPAAPSRALRRAALLAKGRDGVSTFRVVESCWFRRRLSTGMASATRRALDTPVSRLRTFWSKRYFSHFRLFRLTVFIVDSPVFAMPTS